MRQYFNWNFLKLLAIFLIIIFVGLAVRGFAYFYHQTAIALTSAFV